MLARLRVDSTGDIPGREQSGGQGGLRREASLRGRGGPRAAHTGDTPPLPESQRMAVPGRGVTVAERSLVPPAS